MATNKRKKGLSETLITLITLGISLFNVTYKVGKLVKAEIHLAVNSLIALIIFSVVCGIVLTTMWIGAMTLLCIYFLSLHWSIVLSISIIMLINFVLLLVLAFFMRKTKKHLFFPCSKQQLQLLKKLIDEEY